jgi:hypothetical protein
MLELQSSTLGCTLSFVRRGISLFEVERHAPADDRGHEEQRIGDREDQVA